MSKTKTQLQKDYINRTLDMAKDMGIDNVDVIISGSESFSLKAEQGELSEYKKSNTGALGVRVIKDQRVGLSFTEDLSDEAIRTTLYNASQNSKFSKVDEYQTIQEGITLDDANPAANIEHAPDANEMIEKSLYLESEVRRRDENCQSAPYNGIAEGVSNFAIGNSRGVLCTHQSKAYTAYTSALVKKGDKNAMHYFADTKRDFRELDYDKVINTSLEVANNFIDASQIKTGDYDVNFEIDLFDNILSSFMLLFSARAAIDKSNPWRDKLGEMVADSRLTFKDDPFFAGGYSVCPFDGEGKKKQVNTLLENGKLAQFLHNSATAKELGLENNFCATRGAKSALGATTSNFIIEAGTNTQDEFNSRRYVEILTAQGLHSGIRPISGEFSLGVSGRVWNNGEIEGYFKDVTVSGNFFKMLSEIELIGDKIESSSDHSLFTPKILFKDLMIAGS
ncbi:TldD/PmbA family protein [Halobacteriovorax sp. HFRX-2_2]|uniref:TldD/PmbA family protein n=1 Tax=unclassified Halobacteriovorax TaxID=2639665 RepID=UPI00371D5452